MFEADQNRSGIILAAKIPEAGGVVGPVNPAHIQLTELEYWQ